MTGGLSLQICDLQLCLFCNNHGELIRFFAAFPGWELPYFVGWGSLVGGRHRRQFHPSLCSGWGHPVVNPWLREFRIYGNEGGRFASMDSPTWSRRVGGHLVGSDASSGHFDYFVVEDPRFSVDALRAPGVGWHAPSARYTCLYREPRPGSDSSGFPRG